MGAFEYQALDSSGRTHKGVLQADTPRAVRQILRERGLNPLEVTALANVQLPVSLRARKLNGVQLSLFTRQLATLLGAGLPIDEALAALSDESGDERSRSFLVSLRSRIMEGSTLAAAFAEFPESFPEIYRASVAAGEQSGKLDQVLTRLADYSEARDQLTQKIWVALAYPLLLMVVAVVVVSGLLVYVVPQIIGVFTKLQQALPLPTRALISLSRLFQSYGWLILIGFIGMIGSIQIFLRTALVRYACHRLLLRLPLIGRLARAANMARCARTLALLMASAVPLLEALSIAAHVVLNLPMRDALKHAALKVREGSTLARALTDSGYFPPIALRLIASGERSGELEQMLEEVANHQQRELDRWLSTLTAVLGPLVILLVGAMVLFIVLAILLPIFNLNQMIK